MLFGFINESDTYFQFVILKIAPNALGLRVKLSQNQFRIIHKSILPFGVTFNISFARTTFNNYIKQLILEIILGKTKNVCSNNVPVWRRSDVVPRKMRSETRIQ